MTIRQLRKAFPFLNLDTQGAPEIAPTPTPIHNIRNRKLKTGVRVFSSGPEFHQLVRNDGRLSSSYQRSVPSFCKKYHITRVYHYLASTNSTATLEVQFSK